MVITDREEKMLINLSKERDTLREENIALQAENDRMRALTFGLIERMERARKILHKGADSMWLMLETSGDVKALKEATND